MKCSVCLTSFATSAGSLHPGNVCPNCGYDNGAPGAKDPKAVLAARDDFRARTLQHAPETRVTSFDRLKPWLGLALGAVIFLFWLRACSSGGWL